MRQPIDRIVLPALVETPFEQNNLLPALLALPDGEPRAGMVLLHGYTGSKETLEDMAVGLAERGYAVVSPDLPLHGERAIGPRGEFHYPFRGDPYGIVRSIENALIDIRTCSRYLQEAFGPSKGRGIAGFSLGGCLTILAMSRLAGEFRTGVSIVGSAYIARLIMSSTICQDIREDLEIGGFDEKSLEPILRPIEATENASGIRNLLMFGADDDQIVPGALVRQTFASLTDPSNELIMFRGCGHFPSLGEVAEHSIPFLARSF